MTYGQRGSRRPTSKYTLCRRGSGNGGLRRPERRGAKAEATDLGPGGPDHTHVSRHPSDPPGSHLDPYRSRSPTGLQGSGSEVGVPLRTVRDVEVVDRRLKSTRGAPRFGYNGVTSLRHGLTVVIHGSPPRDPRRT